MAITNFNFAEVSKMTLGLVSILHFLWNGLSFWSYLAIFAPAAMILVVVGGSALAMVTSSVGRQILEHVGLKHTSLIGLIPGFIQNRIQLTKGISYGRVLKRLVRVVLLELVLITQRFMFRFVNQI